MKILQRGAARHHYEGLQNSSRLIARLGSVGCRLGTGTTRNEQLHRELKSWSRNIYQCHRSRLQNGFRIFELAKLLTHASAAYSPTLTQFRQRKLLSLICGRLRPERFFPDVVPVQKGVSTTPSLHTALLKTSTTAVLLRKKVRQENIETWEKSGSKLRKGKPSGTDIFDDQGGSTLGCKTITELRRKWL